MGFVAIAHFLAIKLIIQKGVWKLKIFLAEKFGLNNNS